MKNHYRIFVGRGKNFTVIYNGFESITIEFHFCVVFYLFRKKTRNKIVHSKQNKKQTISNRRNSLLSPFHTNLE